MVQGNGLLNRGGVILAPRFKSGPLRQNRVDNLECARSAVRSGDVKVSEKKIIILA